MLIRFSKTADKELKDWLKSNPAAANKIYDLIEDILFIISCKGHYEDK